ncbi:MAG TPA: protein kinase [Kofleriaceae bacterium]|nr:protein kinase [Kofleriaceae bacterium]
MASDPPAKGGDDLGRTATAPGSSTRAEVAESLGASLGRYRLERELGEGGMGVVHAAYDPDLQRRIALKVLRIAAPSLEAKDRLLREARAMARLAHPNVVTVHEVGTANGRDYVAMELILGDTLAEWLRSERQRKVDIVAAFLAAGRGLAAAHAAGIVHRDFKPHNVLRSRAGRIVVTDFGLAREAQAELPAHHDSMPIAARPVMFPDSTPSSLSGITATGSLLGTPAYMAPEQWVGGAVTPATDQFAYCVALWEALAGERPFRGPTIDELRAQAAVGPSARAAAKIPRRLRPILRRGLDPDPAQRWPNMDALLAQIVRVERRPALALALGVGALLVAAIVFVAVRAGDELAAHPRCQPSVLQPERVWSPSSHTAAGRQTVAARLLDREVAAWGTAHAAACQLGPVERAPKLWCLDGVLARIDAVARATLANRNAPQIDAGALLIDPKVCELERAPRLMASASEDFRKVVTALLVHSASPAHQDEAAANQLVGDAKADPCALALAHLLAAEQQKSSAVRAHHLDEAQQEAERCGDDRVLAETAIASAQRMMDSEWLSSTVTAKLRLAEAAALRVKQDDLIAQVDLLKVEIAKRDENLDEAIRLGERAIAGFEKRGRLRAEINAGLGMLALQQIRATPADLAAVPAQLKAWRARAVTELGDGDVIVQALDLRAAEWAFDRGDVAGAHEQLSRVMRSPLDRSGATLQKIAGIVVDPRGQPMPGATVTAGRSLHGDSAGAGTAVFAEHDTLRMINTGPDGRFEIPDAVEDSVVVAELGDRRSSPETIGPDPLRLVLGPTSRLEGHVDLAGKAPTSVRIFVKDLARPITTRYSTIAPVAADGSFVIDGVPRHEVRVFADIDGLSDKVMGGTTLTVREPVVGGLALSLAQSTRQVHVLVRSLVNPGLENAEVIVFPGRVASMNALEINRQFHGGSIRWARQLEGEHAPPDIMHRARPGDLFATMTEIPEGGATACATALPGLSDDVLEHKLAAHLDKLQVICAPIPDDASVVLIQVPPFPRLD